MKGLGNRKADLVISGNCIFNGIDDQTTSGAIAISENRIIKFGPEAEIKPLITSTTKQSFLIDVHTVDD